MTDDTLHVEDPKLTVLYVENLGGWIVTVDDGIAFSSKNPADVEGFLAGLSWCGENFGWASDRLARFGELAQRALADEVVA